MIKTRREARRIGKLGKGKRKTYLDPDAAKEQRRLAGIASGNARRAKRDLLLTERKLTVAVEG